MLKTYLAKTVIKKYVVKFWNKNENVFYDYDLLLNSQIQTF